MDAISWEHKQRSIQRIKPELKLMSENNFSIVSRFILFLLLCATISTQAQEISYSMISEYNQLFNKVIGLDENLINGHQYFDEYPKAKGHAFLDNNEFISGNLVINNKTYADVEIKYDILNQDVILRYKNSFGSMNQIVLQKNFITEFEIDDKQFKKLYFEETGTQFFQVVSSKEIKCIYFWEKTLTISSSSLKSYYDYSDQRKKTYLVINDTLKQYKGKRLFIRLFPEEQKSLIKKYIKKHKINFRDASDKSIKELIEFCESLKHEGKSI
jgi:hypothetical protein